MPIQDVVVVAVPVSDQDGAKAFYVDTLGFELVSDDDSVPGLHWIRVLDWLLITGRGHLERVLRVYVEHDNVHRPRPGEGRRRRR
jgi:catechol 2,3-dioxygenase-like lactoylglutathione lyase family enzyme